MIALILGGAPSVFAEAEEAARLLGRRHMVVAANLAGIAWRGRLDGWATLHTDLVDGWATQRADKRGFRRFSPDVTPERWPGSSGLYALQCALFDMGATGAILCGVPMDSAAGHFSVPGAWAGTADYRRAFEAALPEIGGRVRSMGGWTADLFGAPTPEWIDAIDITRPAGVSADPNARNDAMYRVRNDGKTTLAFNGRDAGGVLQTFRIAPGDTSEPVDVNPDSADFVQHDGAVVTPSRPAAPRPSKVSAPAKKRASKGAKAATSPSTAVDPGPAGTQDAKA